MTRKFLQDIVGQIASTLPDNTTGQIIPANHRVLLNDLLDSSVQDEAALSSTAQTPVSVSIGNTWTTLSDALGVTIYDTTAGGDGEFLIPAQTAGTITGSATAGFSYNAKGAVQLDAANNVVIECALGLDGVPGDLIGSIIGTEGARQQGVYVERYVPSTPANAVFSLMLRAPAGTTSVDLVVRTFGLIILPTRNP